MTIIRILLLASWIVISGCAGEEVKNETKPAIPFTLSTTDSVQHKLQDYHGKIVMLNFWADWCPSCRKEFPKMQQVYEKLKMQGFVILAVNSGQSWEHVSQIKEEFGLTFPVLVDEQAGVAKLYNVKGLPASYFIDENSMIQEVYIGWIKEEKIIEIFNQIKSRPEKT